MRNFLIFAIAVVFFFSLPGNAFAGWEEPSADQLDSNDEPATQEQVADLQSEIEDLKDIIQALLADQTGQLMISVPPVQDSYKIPQVGENLREIIVSALSGVGLPVSEVLDDETLNWIRRQDQLVREGVIAPIGAPRLGEMQAASHLLLASVTKYEEYDEELIIGGIICIAGAGTRERRGSIVIDFRLVDARTGELVSAFRTEATLKLREVAGAVVDCIGFGGFSHKQPLPEVAARLCAEQAAVQVSEALGLAECEE